MRSIGIDLQKWEKKGLLQFQANRPTVTGLEMHLTMMHKAIYAFKPKVVIVDPLNSFVMGGNATEVKAMLIRLVDFLKMKEITGLFTNLTGGGGALEQTDIAISSLIDTWLLLRDIEIGGERNRGMYILKSRGMAHSNQIREFLITDHGIELRDVYVGSGGVLTGSARLAQEAQEQTAQIIQDQDVERRKLDLERKRKVMEAQIAAIRAEFEAQETEAMNIIGLEQAREAHQKQERVEIALIRKADAKPYRQKGNSK
jgi:circadian clock protein KaiC